MTSLSFYTPFNVPIHTVSFIPNSLPGYQELLHHLVPHAKPWGTQDIPAGWADVAWDHQETHTLLEQQPGVTQDSSEHYTSMSALQQNSSLLEVHL